MRVERVRIVASAQPGGCRRSAPRRAGGGVSPRSGRNINIIVNRRSATVEHSSVAVERSSGRVRHDGLPFVVGNAKRGESSRPILFDDRAVYPDREGGPEYCPAGQVQRQKIKESLVPRLLDLVERETTLCRSVWVAISDQL